MRKSKTSQKRKRKKRIVINNPAVPELSLDDYGANRQGNAIARHNQIVVKTPRINFTYRIGDYTIPSGKSHRHIG